MYNFQVTKLTNMILFIIIYFIGIKNKEIDNFWDDCDCKNCCINIEVICYTFIFENYDLQQFTGFAPLNLSIKLIYTIFKLNLSGGLNLL